MSTKELGKNQTALMTKLENKTKTEFIFKYPILANKVTKK